MLSTYVQDFTALGINVGKRWEISHLCEVVFDGFQQPRNQRARVRQSLSGARRQQDGCRVDKAGHWLSMYWQYNRY